MSTLEITVKVKFDTEQKLETMAAFDRSDEWYPIQREIENLSDGWEIVKTELVIDDTD